MLYAYRGVGKTHVALGIACAVAHGGSFLRWTAARPRKVLFIDGEMPGPTLQERLKQIVLSNNYQHESSMLRILTPDLQERAMPDISAPEGQALIDEQLESDTELIVVDNLSSLVRTGKENEAESWLPLQTWALGHRKQGRSILFVHHANRSGGARGTSRREDLLDLVIKLERPADYKASDGAVFEVSFEKNRSVRGEDVQRFCARLITDSDNEQQSWTVESADESNYDRALKLLQAGESQSMVANKLGIHKATVSKYGKKARADGLMV